MSLRRSGRGVEAVLFGDQKPRILSCPEASTSAGREAVDLAAACGLILDPWQRLVLDYSLREDGKGRWAAFEVAVMVSRQNGKGALLEARELAGMLLFGEKLIIHSAHEFSTALEALRRLEELLANSDEAHRIKRVSRSDGQEGIELKNGSRVQFRTRTGSGGRGLSGDLVILDEAMILQSAAMKALMPTLAARPNPQVWYTGSAVDQNEHVHGVVFASVRERGLANDPGLCYLEWSCEPGARQTDPRSWARSNPSMGYRISADYIESEQRAFRHDPKGFDVERLGIGDWPSFDSEIRSAITGWSECVDVGPELVGSRVIAVHRSRDRSCWAVVAAQMTTAGRVHVEVGPVRSGSHAVVAEYLVAKVADWNPVALVFDRKNGATVLEPLLVERGIEPQVTNTADMAHACGGFFDDALIGRVSHSDQDVLNAAVGCAVMRELPGGDFAWKEDDAGVAAPLVAASLAHWALRRFGVGQMVAARPVYDRVDGSGPVRSSAVFDVMTANF